MGRGGGGGVESDASYSYGCCASRGISHYRVHFVVHCIIVDCIRRNFFLSSLIEVLDIFKLFSLFLLSVTVILRRIHCFRLILESFHSFVLSSSIYFI